VTVAAKSIQYESHYERYEETGVNYIASPEETFNNKVGCCAEFAVFARYVLQHHGYDAKILSIRVESKPWKGHAVCVYESSDWLYTINVGREDIGFDHERDWSGYRVYPSCEDFQQCGRPDKVVHRK